MIILQITHLSTGSRCSSIRLEVMCSYFLVVCDKTCGCIMEKYVPNGACHKASINIRGHIGGYILIGISQMYTIRSNPLLFYSLNYNYNRLDSD